MRPLRPVLACLVGTLVLTGCAGPGATDVPDTGGATGRESSDTQANSSAQNNVQVSAPFSAPPGTAVTYDETLVPVGARGGVTAQSGDDRTTVTLAVEGLTPNRQYGAHAHTDACGATGKDAGPHFQFEQDPVQPSVDPAFANPENEIWLDFTTDAQGNGTATTTVDRAFPDDRRAASVVVHAMSTATGPGEAGTAGDRAACITVAF